MNKNFWELYKNSERGKEKIALFQFDIENDDFELKLKNLFLNFYNYLGGKDLEEQFLIRCFLIIDNIQASKLYLDEGEDSETYFAKLVDNLELWYFKEDDNGGLVRDYSVPSIINKEDYKSYCAVLPEISSVLYLYGDFFYFPIFFRENFDVLIKLFDVLEIPMPDLPAKSDKRGRLLFYNSLNENINEFAERYSLNDAEACACIYDFAFMLLDEIEKDLALPEPTNIWLTGGSKEDYKQFLQNPKEGAKSVWTCSEYTKRGDIIIMYVLSPYSCIHSVWRADIDGVYTPFNYYNSRTKATDGILIPPITLNELKADPYFSQLPITRKNFQGVNGVKFSATDYKELQRMFLAKGFDVAVLPQLYNPGIEFEHELKNEKDVEKKLLIPLLSKLGFAESDWTRQLSQKAGRKEKAIPDFVFLPKGEIHFQNAPMIIEAKFDMGTNIERTKTYNQALSYARMMKSKIFGICDRDRLIIYKEKEGYFNRFTPTFEKHWQSINDAETFAELKLIVGKEAINQNC